MSGDSREWTGPGSRRRCASGWSGSTLGDCYRKRNEELSKGMQQKVQFIASVIHKPDLIILDEPFSGLDPVNRRLLRELIEEQHKAGRTVIFSTHSMFEAEQLCTHLFMIHKGEKKLDGTVEEIWRTYDPRTCVHIVPAPGAGDAVRTCSPVGPVCAPCASPATAMTCCWMTPPILRRSCAVRRRKCPCARSR